MDEQWGYVGAKSRQRWLFYAYDRAAPGTAGTEVAVVLKIGGAA
nr:IS1 family transposase [Escherichia coli]